MISKKLLNIIENKKTKHKYSQYLIQIKKKYHKNKNKNIMECIPRKIKKNIKSFRNRINKLRKRINKIKSRNIAYETSKIESIINNNPTKCDKIFWKTINKITNSG